MHVEGVDAAVVSGQASLWLVEAARRCGVGGKGETSGGCHQKLLAGGVRRVRVCVCVWCFEGLLGVVCLITVIYHEGAIRKQLNHFVYFYVWFSGDVVQCAGGMLGVGFSHVI